MVTVLVYMLIALTCFSVIESAYGGKGEIYFTHYNKAEKTGVKVVYRPENYTIYSEAGEGRTAYLEFIHSSSEAVVKYHYREFVLSSISSWAELRWDHEGSYYYYKQNSSTIGYELWFGYGVAIYDLDSKLIYEDIYHFGQVPAVIEDCELDTEASGSDIKCSEILANSLEVHKWNDKVINATNEGQSAYSGTGKTLFTHYNQSSERGIRVVYKPANYQKYSPLGDGRTAMMGFSGYPTESYAKNNYQQQVLGKKYEWAILEWEGEGNYYYHQQLTGNVDPGNWFGYGVMIYNTESELIYKDFYHFYIIPSEVEYCELDSETLNSATICSNALDGPLSIHYWNVETTETPANSRPEYNGTGKIYFTNRYQGINIGIRVVYRPEDYQKYSPLGEAETAAIGFYGYESSESVIQENYVQEVLNKRLEWFTMQWENEGKYYYHEQSSGSLSPGKWVAVGVAIHSADGRLIYEDINHFYQLPLMIEYCELDGKASAAENKCSEALEGRLNQNDATGDGEDNINRVSVIAPLWIIGLVGGVIIAIIITIVICVKKGCCRRANDPQPATTAVPMYVAGNQGFVSSTLQISDFNGASGPSKYQPTDASQRQVDLSLKEEKEATNVPGYVDTKY